MLRPFAAHDLEDLRDSSGGAEARRPRPPSREEALLTVGVVA